MRQFAKDLFHSDLWPLDILVLVGWGLWLGGFLSAERASNGETPSDWWLSALVGGGSYLIAIIPVFYLGDRNFQRFPRCVWAAIIGTMVFSLTQALWAGVYLSWDQTKYLSEPGYISGLLSSVPAKWLSGLLFFIVPAFVVVLLPRIVASLGRLVKRRYLTLCCGILLIACGAFGQSSSRAIDLRGIHGPYRFYKLRETDARELWSVGAEGQISYVSDVGRKQFSLPERVDLNDVFFVNSEGWVVGRGGKIFYSSDKAQTWSREESGTTENLKSIFCLDDQTCWAAGNSGTILRYYADTKTWQSLPTGHTTDISQIEFWDKRTGWAAGDQSVLTTNDGGTTWKIVDLKLELFPGATGLSKGDLCDLSYIHFEGTKKGWAGCSSGVAFTSDGGKTWRRSYFPVVASIIGVVRLPIGKLVAVSAYGNNLESRDEGHTWMPFDGSLSQIPW